MFSSLSRVKLWPCQNIPRAGIEPQLFSNKNYKNPSSILLRAFLKIRLVKLPAWSLYTASQKFGSGLWARAQARSTSNLNHICDLNLKEVLTSDFDVSLGLDGGRSRLVRHEGQFAEVSALLDRRHLKQSAKVFYFNESAPSHHLKNTLLIQETRQFKKYKLRNKKTSNLSRESNRSPSDCLFELSRTTKLIFVAISNSMRKENIL